MKLKLLCLGLVFIFLSGCAANQKVEWNDDQAVNGLKISAIEVGTSVNVPSSELEFLREDIESKVSNSEFWSSNPSEYTLKVVIDKYDEGNAFARFMLIGLGQMHLHGSVEILAGDPPRVIKSGRFEKDYVVGGIAGGMATMHEDVVVKVGNAIVEALNNPGKAES